MKDEYFIGLDIGGTSAKIGLVNRNGNIIEKSKAKTLETNNWIEIINNFLKCHNIFCLLNFNLIR